MFYCSILKFLMYKLLYEFPTPQLILATLCHAIDFVTLRADCLWVFSDFNEFFFSFKRFQLWDTLVFDVVISMDSLMPSVCTDVWVSIGRLRALISFPRHSSLSKNCISIWVSENFVFGLNRESYCIHSW